MDRRHLQAHGLPFLSAVARRAVWEHARDVTIQARRTVWQCMHVTNLFHFLRLIKPVPRYNPPFTWRSFMGLLDQIFGGAGDQPQANAQQGHSMLQNVLAMLQSPKVGGLSGLMAMMQSKGLGNVAQSWIGKGQNQSISPQQLQGALGEEQIAQYAQQTGMSHDEAAKSLSQALPHVVDHLTPDGQVPQQGVNWSDAMSSLATKFFH